MTRTYQVVREWTRHPYWSRALPTVSVAGALPRADFEADDLDQAITLAFNKGAVEVLVFGKPMSSADRRRWYGRQVRYVHPAVF